MIEASGYLNMSQLRACFLEMERKTNPNKLKLPGMRDLSGGGGGGELL